jgi:hypothetical protein
VGIASARQLADLGLSFDPTKRRFSGRTAIRRTVDTTTQQSHRDGQKDRANAIEHSRCRTWVAASLAATTTFIV